jgi:hypothetical protein
MRSTQYPIELARNYDMTQIEERVRLRGQAFERLDGLALKAFLVRSASTGAKHNCYAPFYVWNDDLAIARFLTGPLFAGVIESFGRPNVIERRVIEFAVVDRSVRPTLATFETAQSDTATQPPSLWQAESRHHRDVLQAPGLLAACTLVDVQAWTTTRVRLWANEASARNVGREAERFDVLRVVGPAPSENH